MHGHMNVTYLQHVSLFLTPSSGRSLRYFLKNCTFFPVLFTYVVLDNIKYTPFFFNLQCYKLLVIFSLLIKKSRVHFIFYSTTKATTLQKKAHNSGANNAMVYLKMV